MLRRLGTNALCRPRQSACSVTPHRLIDNLRLTIHDCSVSQPPWTVGEGLAAGTGAPGVRTAAPTVAYVDMTGAEVLHDPQQCRQIYRSGASIHMDTPRGSTQSASAHALACPPLGRPRAQMGTVRFAILGTPAGRLAGMNMRRGSGRVQRPILHACLTPRLQTYHAARSRVGAVERTGPQVIPTGFDANAPDVHRRRCTPIPVALRRRARGTACPSVATAASGRVTHIPPVGHAAVTLIAPAQGYAAHGLRIPRTVSVTPETARGTRRTR